jgi:hypothetical protein
MRKDSMTKPLGADVPDTHEMPRVAAALVVRRIPASEHGMHGSLVTETRLEVVRIVDFYVDDKYR